MTSLKNFSMSNQWSAMATVTSLIGNWHEIIFFFKKKYILQIDVKYISEIKNRNNFKCNTSLSRPPPAVPLRGWLRTRRFRSHLALPSPPPPWPCWGWRQSQEPAREFAYCSYLLIHDVHRVFLKKLSRFVNNTLSTTHGATLAKKLKTEAIKRHIHFRHVSTRKDIRRKLNCLSTGEVSVIFFVANSMLSSLQTSVSYSHTWARWWAAGGG